MEILTFSPVKYTSLSVITFNSPNPFNSPELIVSHFRSYEGKLFESAFKIVVVEITICKDNIINKNLLIFILSPIDV